MNAMTNFSKPEIREINRICEKHKIKLKVFSGREFCEICSTERYKKAQTEHKISVNTSVREKHFAGALLPDRHAESGFKNYSVTHEGQRNAKAECHAYAKDFNNPDVKQKRNLIMYGRTGTGKTHLACAIARNVLDKRSYARYVTSEDMANEIATAWKKTDDSEASAVFRFTDYDLLIIDEYGLHDQHESRLQLVHKVLYSRYDAKKPTVLISNWTEAQLKESLGDRLWSRFQHDGLTVVECNWTDARTGGVL
ncbi:ATP-binding protein [Acinetobacter vivianii]|uniref:ATP-binding protein n=1 Tax=Acinetobacter vivianii TaxID=1776742 RepID=A0AAJ6NGY3_9GAMM|nr:ATP-binding protein [Acinetobacter vivianii]WDZ50204.1 ATP-binding protein [Acinetobacter vivianii]